MVVAVAVSSFKVILVPDAPAILFQLIAGTIPGLADAAIVFTPPEKLTPILAARLGETVNPKNPTNTVEPAIDKQGFTPPRN